MTVTDVRKDTEALTMTITAHLDASVERAWQLWADPRQLERWWGPSTYPATVVDHELVPGGRVTYFMTSPEGDRYHGWWTVITVDPPHTLELLDGFGNEDGTPNESMPTTTTVVTLVTHDEGGTRMTIESRFPTLDAMEQMISMGVEEGMMGAMSQIPAILAESS
jgi:uncharacterized protein YndB with AHSA1/START domain